MNPFSVGVAQGIAGIDVFSGAGFRMVMWVVFTALGCGMTMFYASKVKKTPTISVAYESDQYFRDQNEKTGLDDGHDFGIGHILVLLTLAATVIWVIWGVHGKGLLYGRNRYSVFFIMRNRFWCYRRCFSYLNNYEATMTLHLQLSTDKGCQK